VKPGSPQTIAKNILKGVEQYAQQNLVTRSNNVSTGGDSVPGSTAGNPDIAKALFVIDGNIVPEQETKAINADNIQSINVLTGENATKKYGEKGKDGAVEIFKKKVNPQPGILLRNTSDALANPVYFVDEKEISKDEVNHISPNSILAINVWKGESAIKKYGEKGKNGVIEITTRKNESVQRDSIPDKVFTKVENEPEFPGGREAWLKYITSQIKRNQAKFTNNDYGTCLVKFVVNTDGSVTNVEDSTMKNTQLAKVAVEAIRSGPKWIPATQNNQVVAAYRLEPITLSQPK